MPTPYGSQDNWKEVGGNSRSIEDSRRLAAEGESQTGSAKEIIARLKSSLGQKVDGSFHKGGTVPKDGNYALKAGEQVVPAPDATQSAVSAGTGSLAQPGPQSAAPDASAQPQQNSPAQDSSSVSDESADEVTDAKEGVDLHKAFSKLNESIIELFDALGVRRTATIQHVRGEDAKDHINAVGQVLPTVGGVTKNFLCATHTEHSKTGGETVLHSTDRLRETIIPANTKESKEAKAAIDACKHFVQLVKSLVGETPEVLKAKSQITLVGKNDGAGMTAWDFGAALLSVPTPLIKLVARLNSSRRHGAHHAALTVHRPEQDQQQDQQQQ